VGIAGVTKVIHHHARQQYEGPVGDGTYVYIGRPTKWGNPFKIGVDGTREEVIEKFRAYWYAIEQTQLRLDALRELPGKTLGCWCAPKPCHGDVIADYLTVMIERDES
jgi:hypothetical protein